MRPALACVALVACSFQGKGKLDDASPIGDDGGDDGPKVDVPKGTWLDGFTKRKPITIDSGSTTKLDKFPVSIAMFDPDLVQTAGPTFTADDGVTTLSYEIVGFDKVSGGVDAWVAVDLPAGAAKIYMYYDATMIAPPAGGPWSGLYAGVWHMTDAKDSVAAHDAHATNMRTPTQIAGRIGFARSYDGDDAWTVDDPTNGSLDMGVRSFAYGGWVYVSSSIGYFDTPIWKGGSHDLEPGYDLELGTVNWLALLSDGTAGLEPFELSFGTETPLLNAWHHLVVVVDRTGQKATSYLDGTQIESKPFTLGSLDTGRNLELGCGTYNQPFRGLLDEVHIYTDAISAEWIAAETKNVTSRGTFVMPGAVETKP